MKWTIERSNTEEHVHFLTVKFEKVTEEFRALWLADLHWDNPKCNLKLLKKHLDAAKAIHAPVIIVGDLFCAMQGKYDKRSHKDDLRPEHRTGKYLDKLWKTAVKWFSPYKEIITVIGYGNHETSILERHETDLLENFVEKIGGKVTLGGYQGWIKFNITRLNTSQRTNWRAYYWHGKRGGSHGPVTKGTIDFARLAERVEADIYVLGHIHEEVSTSKRVFHLNSANRTAAKKRDFIRLATYKETGTGPLGFDVERGYGLPAIGGKWLIVNSECGDGQYSYERRWLDA